MTNSERLSFFRKKRKLTQKQLGIAVGFAPGSADVRIAQYETGQRNPNQSTMLLLAKKLNVSPFALSVPSVRENVSLMHMLFMLEDCCGLSVTNLNDKPCLQFSSDRSPCAAEINSNLYSWLLQKEKYLNNTISKEEYDQWRYCYPNKNSEVK